MSQSFPTSVPSYPDTTGDEVLGAAGGGIGLSRILDDYGLDIAAIATKLGTGADTPASGQVLRGNGAGTSEWADLDLTTDVTGLLPASNLAGFSSATLRGLLTDETGGGAAVFANSPTIVTPTIASFEEANHSHENDAGGGVLAAAAMPNLALNTQALSNPYKFSAAKSAATQTVNSGATDKITFDAEDWDTNSNFASSTYTAAVAGFYLVIAGLGYNAVASATRLVPIIFKNGSQHRRGDDQSVAAQTGNTGVQAIVQLAATDTLEIHASAVGANIVINNTPANTYFQVILLCQT